MFAEKRLRRKRLVPGPSSSDLTTLNHELQVHQLELELQNLELTLARDDLAKELAARSLAYRAIGHDISQPILAARLYLKALFGTGLNAEQRRLMTRIDEATEAVAKLAATIAELAAPLSNATSMANDWVELRPLLSELRDQHQAMAQAKGLELHLRAGVVSVRSDGLLLRRILDNLIANAVRHTQHGRVLVGTRRAGKNGVRIEVRDSGPGIAPERIPRIFDEFYQVGNPERNPDNGYGLGLAISRRLAHSLGLTLDLRTRVGKGSVFFVTLPRADGAAVS
jgi:signal transduction histidine kinase